MNHKPISYWDFINDEPSPMVKETAVVYGVATVRDGLAISEFYAMQQLLGVTEERLASFLGMSRATLHRRKKSGHLDRSESDRLVRYVRLTSRASAVFGGDVGARSWLVAPAIAFEGESPMDYADTEVGAREVEALLGRIENGVFS